VHHSPPDRRAYNDALIVTHRDHLVIFEYDDEYLYDPVHHYLFDRPNVSSAKESQ
jgi:hypothetical protein